MSDKHYLDHYQTRITAISGEVARLKRTDHPLCFLGDSITEQNPNKELVHYRLVNMGIDGDMISHPQGGVLGRMWLLPMATPAKVVILVGVNDLIHGKSIDQFDADYHKMVQAVQKNAPGVPFTLCLLTPVRGHFEHVKCSVAMANCTIEHIAAEYGLGLIDTYGPLMDDEGDLRQSCTTDGLHLNAEGYAVLNDVLESELTLMYSRNAMEKVGAHS